MAFAIGSSSFLPKYADLSRTEQCCSTILQYTLQILPMADLEEVVSGHQCGP